MTATPAEVIAAPSGPVRPAESPVRSIIAASSALGVATGLERGLGFAANFLAARLGGASVFGGYSLALTTANNIASYAGGGIGSTATRFSGEYNASNDGYAPVARALALVSIVSAALATGVLFLGAGPLAQYLLRSPQLTNLMRWSALSAGAMVLLECARGFLIGQRNYALLLLLCGISGGGLLCGLPLAAQHGSAAMVMAQSAAMLTAIAICAILIRRRVIAARSVTAPGSSRALVLSVWRFGMMQLAGNVGLNAAGWWMASLIARADTTLVQMGVFAVASQLRNMAALVPGLVTQGSYGMIAQRRKGKFAPHERVMVLCSLGSGLTSIAIAGCIAAILPWILPALFGASFRSGVVPGSLALSTAIVHMSAGPAAARLTVVSLRMTGIVNAVWAALVALLATLFITGHGATEATAIYLVAHLVSAGLVVFFLRAKESVPQGFLGLSAIAHGTAIALALLALLRNAFAAWEGRISVAMLLLVVISSLAQIFIARRRGWIPSKLDWNTFAALVPVRLRRARPSNREME